MTGPAQWTNKTVAGDVSIQAEAGNLRLANAVNQFIAFDVGPNTTALNEAMRINNVGAVGVGTTTPAGGAILDINGTGVNFSSLIVPRGTTALRRLRVTPTTTGGSSMT